MDTAYYDINNDPAEHMHRVTVEDFVDMHLEQYCQRSAEELAELLSTSGQIDMIEVAMVA